MLRINCINFESALSHPLYEGQLIREAYLYADVTVVSGGAYVLMDFENQYNSNLNDQLKRRTIEAFCEYLNPPVQLQAATGLFSDLKELRAIIKISKPL